jgi:hypothetical protein
LQLVTPPSPITPAPEPCSIASADPVGAAPALSLARGAALEAAIADEASTDIAASAPASSRAAVFEREHDPRRAMAASVVTTRFMCALHADCIPESKAFCWRGPTETLRVSRRR